jgi:hypothetical protein
MLGRFVLFLSVLTTKGCSGSDSWGYQNHGFGGLIDVDDAGSLYFAGLTSELGSIFTHSHTYSVLALRSSVSQRKLSTGDYLVSKISPHGDL